MPHACARPTSGSLRMFLVVEILKRRFHIGATPLQDVMGGAGVEAAGFAPRRPSPSCAFLSYCRCRNAGPRAAATLRAMQLGRHTGHCSSKMPPHDLKLARPRVARRGARRSMDWRGGAALGRDARHHRFSFLMRDSAAATERR